MLAGSKAEVTCPICQSPVAAAALLKPSCTTSYSALLQGPLSWHKMTAATHRCGTATSNVISTAAATTLAPCAQHGSPCNGRCI
jgi:hypothetical protein